MRRIALLFAVAAPLMAASLPCASTPQQERILWRVTFTPPYAANMRTFIAASQGAHLIETPSTLLLCTDVPYYLDPATEGPGVRSVARACPVNQYPYEVTGKWPKPRTLCLTYQQAADVCAEEPGVKVRLAEPVKAPAKRKGKGTTQ